MKKLLSFLILILILSSSTVLAQEIEISGSVLLAGSQETAQAADGNHLLLGTPGSGQNIQGFRLTPNTAELGLAYQSYVAGVGWQNPVTAGELSGVPGQSIEAIRILPQGSLAESYNLFYRTYINNYGFLDWTLNGESSGTVNHGYGIEAIELLVLPKTAAAPGNTKTAFVFANNNLEAEHLKLVNQLRISNGKSFVSSDPALYQVAELRASELTQNITHTRPNGQTYETAVKSVFPNYRLNGGGFVENICWGVPAMSQPVRSYQVFTIYPQELNRLLEDSVKYVSWAGTNSGTMGYAVELISGLDRIDFAD